MGGGAASSYTCDYRQKRKTARGMESLSFGMGVLWIILTIGAAAFLGTDFILDEIRILLRHRHGSDAERNGLADR